MSIAKNFDLIGGKLIAGDSTRLRAENSKKNNYNPKKIDRHLAYIEEKLETYTRALAEADQDHQELIRKEITKHQSRKAHYHALEKRLEENGEPQVSTSDPDSRQLITRNNITEVAYNVQTTVEAKHCKRRQAIVEHPYGTIKRQWGFYHILTKKRMKRASADVGLMFIAYNLRRMMNILDKNSLKAYLERLAL